MYAKVFNHPKLGSVKGAIDKSGMYIDGSRIAQILGYEQPDIAVNDYLGSERYTPLKLNKTDDLMYLITGAKHLDPDFLAELLNFIYDIENQLQRDYYD